MIIDISPLWQKRAEQMRETIRSCKCDGEKLRNLDNGREFCATCAKYTDGQDHPTNESGKP